MNYNIMQNLMIRPIRIPRLSSGRTVGHFLKNILFIVTATFFQIQAGPTELFENFLKTNPTVDILAKELDKLSNISVRSVALKRVQTKYGSNIKGELEVVAKAPAGQATWALHNYRSASKTPTIITHKEIIKDTEESDRLKAENARLAAQLAAAHGEHLSLQEELKLARSQQSSPTTSRRGSESNAENIPVPPRGGPPAPPVPGGMPLGAPPAPALPGGGMRLGGGDSEAINLAKKPAVEEPKAVDKADLTMEEKKLSDEQVLAALVLLAETESSYAKINNFEEKIYTALAELYKNKKFNNRVKLEEAQKELKALLEHNKPINNADFKEYYKEKTTRLDIGSAGEIEISIFDTPTEKYNNFLGGLKKIFETLFFDPALISDFNKKAIETLTLNYLAGQRTAKKIPTEKDKPNTRNEEQKKSDRIFMATIIDIVKALETEEIDRTKKLKLTEHEQKEKAEKLKSSLDWLRINPAFLGYGKMLPSSKEKKDEKAIIGAQPEIPLLLLMEKNKLSANLIKSELLNHIYLNLGDLQAFLDHVDKELLTKMALLLSKKEKEEKKEEKKEDAAISPAAQKLIEILVSVREQCKDDKSKRFENLLLLSLEQNKDLIESLNRANYSNLTKMLNSFKRRGDSIYTIITTLLGAKQSPFLQDKTTITNAYKTLGINLTKDRNSNIVLFNYTEIEKLLGETPVVIQQFDSFTDLFNKIASDKTKKTEAKEDDYQDIYKKFASSFSSQKETIKKEKEDFKSPEFKTIEKILKDSLDSKGSIIQEIVATMGEPLYKIKNSADSKITSLYKTKAEKESKEIIRLIKKQIEDSKFCQQDNPELIQFIDKLQLALLTTLPLVYKKIFADAYEKARKEHEKI